MKPLTSACEGTLLLAPEGIARTLSKGRYTPHRAAAELRRLLENPFYSQRASEVAAQIRQENGVESACDALEALLQSRPVTS